MHFAVQHFLDAFLKPEVISYAKQQTKVMIN